VCGVPQVDGDGIRYGADSPIGLGIGRFGAHRRGFPLPLKGTDDPKRPAVCRGRALIFPIPRLRGQAAATPKGGGKYSVNRNFSGVNNPRPASVVRPRTRTVR
jgi:hypothetical protein